MFFREVLNDIFFDLKGAEPPTALFVNPCKMHVFTNTRLPPKRGACPATPRLHCFLAFLGGIFTLALFFVCFFPRVVYGQSVFEQPVLSMQEGMRLSFEAHSVVHPLRPPVQENFELVLSEVWDSGISFRYEIVQKVMGKAQGLQTLSSLDTCTALDPWWEPMQTDYDDRCEFWVPKFVFRELLTEGRSYLSVDTEARRDSTVRWENVGKTLFLVTLDGRPTLLEAIRVKTSREDEFLILNDVSNPLILSAKSTFFSWRLQKILTKK